MRQKRCEKHAGNCCNLRKLLSLLTEGSVIEQGNLEELTGMNLKDFSESSELIPDLYSPKRL